MPVIIDEVTAQVDGEQPQPEEQAQAPAAAPSLSQQLALLRRQLRRLEQRQARLRAD
jgi:hypothetical protein